MDTVNYPFKFRVDLIVLLPIEIAWASFMSLKITVSIVVASLIVPVVSKVKSPIAIPDALILENVELLTLRLCAKAPLTFRFVSPNSIPFPVFTEPIVLLPKVYAEVRLDDAVTLNNPKLTPVPPVVLIVFEVKLKISL